MKVLHINATYGIGSTGRNVAELHEYLLKHGVESYVAWATKSNDKRDNKNIFRIGTDFDHKCHALLYRITGKQGYHSTLSTKILCDKIEMICPDIVHLNNLHSNFINFNYLLDYLIKKNISTVLTLHDCWFFTGRCYHYTNLNCNKWKYSCNNCRLHKFWNTVSEQKLLEQKKEKYLKIDHLGIIGVSDWITNEARKGILNPFLSIKRIYNWIDLEIFFPQTNVREERKKWGVGDKKVIIGVSQEWDKKKGLSEMLHIAKEIPDAAIILIGKCAKVQDFPLNIIPGGFISDTKSLAALYSLADVFVNPSRMETFGKVTAEAMACGTPAVVYNNTGSKELIGNGCGIVVEDANIAEMVSAVKTILKKGKKTYSQSCIKYVRENFNKEKQLGEYLDFYKKLKNDKEQEYLCTGKDILSEFI